MLFWVLFKILKEWAQPKWSIKTKINKKFRSSVRFSCMLDYHDILKSVLRTMYCHKCWMFSVGLPDPFITFSSLLCGSGDWPLQTYHSGSRALWPPVGFSQQEMRQEVGEVEEWEVWVLTRSPTPSASMWCGQRLWPSIFCVATLRPQPRLSSEF